jgi:hydrogenase/urease accessory protein HupE
VHHIFIGPDHILFVVGLLLLGGSLGQLLKIVTAFTIAHSITLGLATFQIVRPPPSLVESVIALSIVCVGISAFFGKRRRDPRLLFAFCFGLIHGFGFANALQEMMLPREALGWSLFAFNGGVEIGQGFIVLTIAPLLALLRTRRPIFAERIVTAGALCVVTAGAFWFFQRVMA